MNKFPSQVNRVLVAKYMLKIYFIYIIKLYL